ncbi:MAG: tail fiber protein [Bacteroidia bacterium]|nr:tail fiber protein [Bacteroidia bacterium]
MDPTLGEIRLFAGTFAPRGWAYCDGTILPIASNTALFSLLGTYYGGDGRTTFALPDLRGRVPLHVDNQTVQLGEVQGSPQISISVDQLPPHNHPASAVLNATLNQADTKDPSNALIAKDRGTTSYSTDAPANVSMPPAAVQGTVAAAGGGQPFDNHQPSLGLSYIICMQGVYPQRP